MSHITLLEQLLLVLKYKRQKVFVDGGLRREIELELENNNVN